MCKSDQAPNMQETSGQGLQDIYDYSDGASEADSMLQKLNLIVILQSKVYGRVKKDLN